MINQDAADGFAVGGVCHFLRTTRVTQRRPRRLGGPTTQWSVLPTVGRAPSTPGDCIQRAGGRFVPRREPEPSSRAPCETRAGPPWRRRRQQTVALPPDRCETTTEMRPLDGSNTRQGRTCHRGSQRAAGLPQAEAIRFGFGRTLVAIDLKQDSHERPSGVDLGREVGGTSALAKPWASKSRGNFATSKKSSKATPDDFGKSKMRLDVGKKRTGWGHQRRRRLNRPKPSMATDPRDHTARLVGSGTAAVIVAVGPDSPAPPSSIVCPSVRAIERVEW